MEYIEIPSKLNRMAFQDIDEADKDYFMPLHNKLIDIENNPTKAHEIIIKEFARKLANLDTNYVERKYIHWDSTRQSYVAQRVIKGVKYKIKTSKEHKVCLDAYMAFCKLHKVQP